MKKVLAVVGAVLLGVATSHATIQVQWTSLDGVLNPGGGTLNSGNLIQLMWSPTDPVGSLGVNAADITGNFGSSLVIWTSTTPAVVIDGASGNITEQSLSITEATLLNGYVYVRLFSSAAPVIGDYFAISTIAGPGLGDMDPAVGNPVPTSVSLDQDVNTEDPFQGIGTNPQIDWVQIVPEPSVLAFLGIGAALVGIRRMRRS